MADKVQAYIKLNFFKDIRKPLLNVNNQQKIQIVYFASINNVIRTFSVYRKQCIAYILIIIGGSQDIFFMYPTDILLDKLVRICPRIGHE